jgi:hypothetical protein
VNVQKNKLPAGKKGWNGAFYPVGGIAVKTIPSAVMQPASGAADFGLRE